MQKYTVPKYLFADYFQRYFNVYTFYGSTFYLTNLHNEFDSVPSLIKLSGWIEKKNVNREDKKENFGDLKFVSDVICLTLNNIFYNPLILFQLYKSQFKL